MASLSNKLSIVKPAYKQQLKGFPNSYSFIVKAMVHQSGTLDHAMKNGAPNTPATAWKTLAAMHKEFPAGGSGFVRKEVLLLCFGEFLHQSRVESFISNIRAMYTLNDMSIRTMLALGDYHRTLCKEKGLRRIRFVSLAHRVEHLGLSHVPTLHQEDRADCVTNAIKLEPYKFGWSAEHVFGFERDVG